MFKRMISMAALVAILGTAQAAEPLERGGYFGGGGGTSLFDDGGAFAGFSQDDTDTALMLFGGYKFFKYLSVEGRYSNFGSFDVEGIGLDGTALSVHAVGIVPFGTSGWELFGQLGIGNVNFEIEGTSDEDQSAFAGGIGIRFSPTPNFAIGVQTDVFIWEDSSLGPTYDMSVGGTMITGRFIF